MQTSTHNYTDYVLKMMGDGRYMTLSEDEVIIGILFFSICDDYKLHLNNRDFQYIPHDVNGKTVVFDNMIFKNFRRKHALQIEESLINRFPQLEKAVWIRDRENGRFTITHNRRNHYAIQY